MGNALNVVHLFIKMEGVNIWSAEDATMNSVGNASNLVKTMFISKIASLILLYHAIWEAL